MPGFTVFEDGTYPTTPKDIPIESFEDVSAAMANVHAHLRNVAGYQDEVSEALTSDFLVKGSQVDSLGVDKLTAGTISVDNIYLLNDQFELDGVNQRIRIKDDSNTTRVDIGRFGAGTSYGIKAWNASGTLFLDLDGLGVDVVGSVQIANGAINATAMLSGAIITETLVATNAITAAKINITNLAAASATLGSVNVTSGTGLTLKSGADITCESGSDINMEDGSDIIMEAGAGGNSTITYENNLGTTVGNLVYSVGGVAMGLNAFGSVDLFIIGQEDVGLQCGTGTGDEVIIGGSTANEIDIKGRINADVDPNTDDGIEDLGSASLRWNNVYAQTTTIGDVRLGNGQGMIITEADKVYEGEDVNSWDFMAVMSHKNKRLMVLDKEGNLYIRGEIRPMKEHKDLYRNHVRKNPVIEGKHRDALSDQKMMDKEAFAKLSPAEQNIERYKKKLIRRGISQEECEELCRKRRALIKEEEDQKLLQEVKKAGRLKRKEYENMMLEYRGGLI